MSLPDTDTDVASPVHVFVYGTLREGEINDIARAAERHGLRRPHHVGGAAIGGRLFDFGPYPGLLPEGDDPRDAAPGATRRVVGDVFRITPALLAVLDDIEGIRADGRDIFYRASCALDVNGARLDCCFYPIDATAAQGCVPIPQGDWVAYRRARDGAPGA